MHLPVHISHQLWNLVKCITCNFRTEKKTAWFGKQALLYRAWGLKLSNCCCENQDPTTVHRKSRSDCLSLPFMEWESPLVFELFFATSLQHTRREILPLRNTVNAIKSSQRPSRYRLPSRRCSKTPTWSTGQEGRAWTRWKVFAGKRLW